MDVDKMEKFACELTRVLYKRKMGFNFTDHIKVNCTDYVINVDYVGYIKSLYVSCESGFSREDLFILSEFGFDCLEKDKLYFKQNK